MIEPPTTGEKLPAGELILGRPPADPQEEIDLLVRHKISWIVSKDSGGQAVAKITAARRLDLPVILIKRPPPPPGGTLPDVDAVLEWVDRAMFSRT
jgi:precorrin-6A/cobalt-precorrin-6A reductase